MRVTCFEMDHHQKEGNKLMWLAAHHGGAKCTCTLACIYLYTEQG